ncbi:uncharacterized protein METZ01_LOCUS460093 [marine metagenome]|uniref:Uncharacterized protein n=1 Tax=marine metagenome TaxID=408172 RepID=A0A383AI63_9ZZZZ
MGGGTGAAGSALALGQALNANSANITTEQISLPTTPSAMPITAPTPALAASGALRPNAHSNPIAPTNGPTISPIGGNTNNPATNPSNAPTMPFHVAPSFFAPSSVAR